MPFVVRQVDTCLCPRQPTGALSLHEKQFFAGTKNERERTPPTFILFTPPVRACFSFWLRCLESCPVPPLRPHVYFPRVSTHVVLFLPWPFLPFRRHEPSFFFLFYWNMNVRFLSLAFLPPRDYNISYAVREGLIDTGDRLDAYSAVCAERAATMASAMFLLHYRFAGNSAKSKFLALVGCCSRCPSSHSPGLSAIDSSGGRVRCSPHALPQLDRHRHDGVRLLL